MTARETLEILEEIFKETGLDSIRTVSKNPLEFADFHIMDQKYLGYERRKLIRFDSIKRVYYSRDEAVYHYLESRIQLVFELNHGYDFFIEEGIMGNAWFEKDQRMICKMTEKEKFKQFLEEYDELEKEESVIISHLYSFLFGFEPEEIEIARAWCKEADRYIEEGKDTEHRVFYTLVLLALVNESSDVLPLAEYTQQLIATNSFYTFVDFFKEEMKPYIEPDEIYGIDEYVDRLLLLKQSLEEKDGKIYESADQ